MPDNEIRTVLRIDGQPSGAIEGMRQLQQQAKTLGLELVKVSQTVNANGVAQAQLMAQRVQTITAEMERLQAKAQQANLTDAQREVIQRRLLTLDGQLTTAQSRLLQAQNGTLTATMKANEANRTTASTLQQAVHSAQVAGASFAQMGQHLVAAGREGQQSLSALVASMVAVGRGGVSIIASLRNIGSYIKSVATSGASLKQAASSVVSYAGSVASAARGTTQWSAVAAHAARSGIDLGKAFHDLVGFATNASRGFASLLSAGAKLASGLGGVVSASTKIASGLGKMAQGSNLVGTAFTSTASHVAGLAVKLTGAQTGLYSLGTAMQSFASLAQRALGDVVSVAGQFQQEVITIKAILGNSPELASFGEQMRQLAITLSETTLFSANDTAEVISELIKGGMDLKEVMGTLKDGSDSATAAVLNLSTATGQDLQTSVTTIISATTEWANSNLQARDAANDLTKVANATASDVKQLAGGMKNAGAIAASMGVSFHDTLVLLGALSNAGLKGPEGGTALRYFLLNLVPTTDKAINMMKDLGLVTYSWGQAMEYAREKGIKLSGSQEQQLDQLYQAYAGTKKTFDEAIADGDKAVSKFQQFLSSRGIITSVFVDQKTGALKNAQDILQIIGDTFAKEGPVVGTKLMSALFGERGGSKAAAPLLLAFQKNLADYQDLTAKLDAAKKKGDTALVNDLTTQLSKIQPNLIASINDQLKNYGDAEDIAKQRTQGWEGSLHFLQSSLQGLMISLGEPLLQPLARLARMFGDLINQATTWAQAHPEMVEFAGTLLAIATGFATIAGPLAMVTAAWPYVIAGISGVAAAALPLVAVMGAVAVGITAVMLAIGDPSTGLLPVLQQAGALLGQTGEELGHLAGAVYLGVVLPAARQVVAVFKENLLPVLTTVISFLKTEALPAFVRVFTFLAVTGPQALRLVADIIGGLILPVFRGLATLVLNQVLPTFQTLFLWLREHLPNAVAFLAHAWSTLILPALSNLWSLVQNYVLPAFFSIAHWLGVVLPPLVDQFRAFWDEHLFPAMQRVAGYLLTNVVPALERLGTIIVQDVLPPVMAVVGYLLDHIDQVATVIAIALVPAFSAWAVSAATAAASTIIALAPVLLAVGAVAAAVLGLKAAFDQAGGSANQAGQQVSKNFLAGVDQGVQAHIDPTKPVVQQMQNAAAPAGQAGHDVGHGFSSGLDQGLGDQDIAQHGVGKVLTDMQGLKNPATTAGYQGGVGFQAGLQQPLDATRTMAQQKLGDITSEFDKARQHIEGGAIQTADHLDQDFIHKVSVALNANVQDLGVWRQKTLAEFYQTQQGSSQIMSELKGAIINNVTTAFQQATGQQITWQGNMLGEVSSFNGQYSALMHDEFTKQFVDAISQATGISKDKLGDWQTMTLDDLASMASPTGAAMNDVGVSLRTALEQQLGISLANVQDWRALNIGQLQSMVSPASQSGYDMGYGFSSNALSGLNANLPGILQTVSTIRKALNAAIAMANAMPNGGGEQMDKRLLRLEGKDRNATAQAQAAGIPGFVLDALAGSSGGAGQAGGYTGPNIPGHPNNGTPDDGSGLPSGWGDMSGGSPYNTNTIPPGKPEKGSSGSKSTSTPRTPAEQAADVANKVANAIKDGLAALRSIAGLVVPSNLQQKAKEFADAVTVLVMALQSVSLKFQNDALNHTQDFADMAVKVVDLVAKGVDALGKLKDFKAPSQAAVQSLVEAVRFVTAAMTAVAAQFQGDALTQTDVFADAAGKVMDLVGKAADSLSKVDGFIAPAQASVQSLVQSVGETVSALQPLASLYTPEALDIIGQFSDGAGKAMDMLGKSVDLFAKLSSLDVSLAGAEVKAQAVAQQSQVVLKYLLSLVQQNGWTDENATTVGGWSDNVGKAVDGLSKAADFFAKLNDPKLNFAPVTEKVRAIVQYSQEMMQLLVQLTLDQSGKPGFTVRNAQKVADYATQVGSVADGLDKASSFFQKLLDPKFLLGDVTARVRQIADESVAMMHYLASLWQQEPAWTVDNADKVGQYATAAGAVADGLTKAADFLQKLAGIKTNFAILADRVRELANASQQMMNVLGPLTAGWQGFTEDVTNWSTAAGSVADSLTKAMDFFAGLAKNKVSFKDLADRVQELVNAVADMQARMRAVTPTDFADNGEDAFLQTVQGVVSTLSGAYDLLDKLGQRTKPKTDPQAVLGELLRFLLAVVQGFHADREQFAAAMDAETAQLAQDVGNAVAGIGQALDFFEKLSTFQGVGPGKIELFLSALRQTVVRLQTVLPLIGDDMLVAAQSFGDHMGPAFQALSDALALFLALTGEPADAKGQGGKPGFTPVDPAQIDAFINGLNALITKLRDGLLNQIAPETMELSQAFAEKIGPAITTLKDALDIFLSIQGTKDKPGLGNLDPNAIGALVYDLYVLLHHWRNVVIGGEFQGDFQERSARFVVTVQGVLQAIQQIVDMATKVGSLDDKSLAALPQVLQEIGSFLAQVFGVQLPQAAGQAATSMENLSTATSQGMQGARDALFSTFQEMNAELERQALGHDEDTFVYLWGGKDLKKSLWARVIDRFNGKAGARWFLVEAVAGLFRAMNDWLGADGEQFFQDWSMLINKMMQDTVSAIADIKAAFQSIDGASISINVTATMPDSSSVPHLANGGIATGQRSVLTVLGDGNEPEMVVPLSKAKEYGFGGPGGGTTHNTTINNIRQQNVVTKTDTRMLRERSRRLTDPFN